MPRAGDRGRTSGAALQPRQQRLRRGRDRSTSGVRSSGAASLGLSGRAVLLGVSVPAFSSAAEGALGAQSGDGENKGGDYGVASGPNPVLPRFRATTALGRGGTVQSWRGWRRGGERRQLWTAGRVQSTFQGSSLSRADRKKVQYARLKLDFFFFF